MENIERKTMVYRIDIKKKWTNRDFTECIILKDILDKFFKTNLNSDGEGEAKFQVPKQYKKYWISSYLFEKNIMKIMINYSIYNQYKDIVDVNTGKTTKKKEKNEGDKERQHLLIKVYPDTNKGVLIFENIHMGIGCRQLRNDIREFVEKTVENNDKISLHVEPLPDKDFIEELMGMRKISKIRIIADKEKCTIDEDVLFSEDNISRDEVEIAYRPVSASSFGLSRVRGFYENYKDNAKKKEKIKRIIIDGAKSTGKARLDTDGMKMTRYITTTIDATGQIDSENILNAYEALVVKEFQNYIDGIVLVNFNEGESNVDQS